MKPTAGHGPVEGGQQAVVAAAVGHREVDAGGVGLDHDAGVVVELGHEAEIEADEVAVAGVVGELLDRHETLDDLLHALAGGQLAGGREGALAGRQVEGALQGVLRAVVADRRAARRSISSSA